jgi:hypothetical protein
MAYQQHPLSAAFPAMSAEDFQGLKDSITEIGVQNPITLFEGMVIDGWHRYTAATELGMDCPVVELGDVDPRHFVLAQNKSRRHVTQAQLAMATTTVYAWRPVGNPAFSQSGTECPIGKSNAQLAEAAGVSEKTIKQAKAVQTKAAPEVIAAVKSGEIGLPKAAAIAKLPKEEQAAAIHKPAPKPAPAVVEPEIEAPPEYTELDAAHDQISDLQAELVVARMGDIPEEEKQQAAGLIAELHAEIKTLNASLKAAYLSRDQLMEENAQMKRQMAMQRREIDKLKSTK